MKVFSDTIIYVHCPGCVASGGPEALHVLAHELRRRGHDARMMYYDLASCKDFSVAPSRIVHDRFKRFGVPYVIQADDNPHNIAIFPETAAARLSRFPSSQRAFWWLSVDFYTRPWEWKGIWHSLWWCRERFRRFLYPISAADITHLCQSYYALDYVRSRGFARRYLLMDYLGDEFLSASAVENAVREDLVVYNPLKGSAFTQKLIAASPDIRFYPLTAMTPGQVRDTCMRSRVYIDFGEHPGKDRFPREAALLGNVIITNRKGSAGFQEDVPIPEEYKFAGTSADIPQIRELILKSFAEYQERAKQFDGYRSFIREDKARFLAQVDEIFIPA